MSNFRSLFQLLYQYKPTVLAGAIEKHGIYFRNDTLGTVKLVKDDCDAWQCIRDPLSMRKIISHIEDEKKAPRNTKSRALVLLEIYIDIRDMTGIFENPMKQSYQMELSNFGWPSADLPDFAAIQPRAVTQTAEKEEEVQASPETEYSNGRRETDPFAVFREMENLAPDDLRLTFLADNYIEVSANGKKRKAHLSVMRLCNRNTNQLTKRGLLLQRMARRQQVQITEANVKQISLIRKEIFQDLLGVQHDPFNSKAENWKPRFTIDEELDRAGERKKTKAQHVNFDDTKSDHGATYQPQDDPNEYPFEDENDDAGKLIRKYS